MQWATELSVLPNPVDAYYFLNYLTAVAEWIDQQRNRRDLYAFFNYQKPRNKVFKGVGVDTVYKIFYIAGM